MLQIWLRAVNPGLTPDKALATFEGILDDEPNPTMGTALLWIAISGVIAAAISGILSLILGLVQGFPPGMVIPSLVSILIFIPIAQIIGFLIGSIILFGLSKVSGGQGTLQSQAYLIAAAQAPLGIVIAILAVIPTVVGDIVSIGGIIYGGWLSLMALRTVHRYSAWRALSVILLPVLVISISVICLLALLGPAVGRVFENIVTDIQREGGAEIVPLSVSSEHFFGDDISLDYPGGWASIDQSENQFCQQPGVDCLFSVGNLSGDGAEINLIRFEFIADMSIEEADEIMWAEFTANMPDATLLEHRSLLIDKQPSMLRVYSFPGVAPESRVYLFQTTTLKDDALYQFTGFADTSETFNAQISMFEDVVESIEID